jgi:hypothetical protein
MLYPAGDAEVGTRRASLSTLAGLAASLCAGRPVAAQGAGPLLVKTPAREQVWLVQEGRRHWIADGATFGARAFRWEDVQPVAPAALRLIPPGPALHDGALLRDAASGDVSLVADGRRRRIVDPLSFTLYGLDWGRVQSLPSTVLERTPPGVPAPHALTGQVFPDLPPEFALPPGQNPRPAPDSRLAAALRLVRDYPPTAAWPAFLERFGVTLRVAPVTGGLASYRAADRTLSVDPPFAEADPRALATLLVHETLHAIYDAAGRTGVSGRACIDEEVAAFGAQAAFWAHHWGPDGRADASSDLERDLNRTLTAAADDALTGRVIGTFGYTLRCYFPGAGGSPEP